MCTAVVPEAPSSALFSAARPYSRAGGEQVRDLVAHRVGVGHGERGRVAVVIVLRLLRHRERAGHSHLDHSVGVRAQELEVADFDRVWPGDGSDHARHRVRMPTAIQRLAGVVDVDAVERGREVVRVALATDLAVGNDVEAGAFLRTDRKQGRVVLGLGEVLGSRPPQLTGPDAWGESAGKLRPVDQPLGLGEAPDERRAVPRKTEHVHSLAYPYEGAGGPARGRLARRGIAVERFGG